MNRLPVPGGLRAQDDGRELAGAENRPVAPFLNDAPRDTAGKSFFTVVSEDAGQLRQGQAIDELFRRHWRLRAETHVQRCVLLEAEAALTAIELWGTDSQIEENPLHAAESGCRRLTTEVVEIRLHETNAGSEWRQPLLRRR